MRVRFAGLLVASAVIIGACGDDDGAAVVEDPTTTAAVERTADPVRDGAVDVLDAGVEPRRELRLRVEAGTERSFVLLQEQDQEIVVAGQSQSSSTTTEQPITYRVDAVESGRIEATTIYGRGRLVEGPDDGSAAIVEEVLAAFDGAEGRATFTDRAEILQLVPPSLDVPSMQPGLDSLLQSMESQAAQLSVPFPREPVGVGARWRVRAGAEVGGLPLEIVTDVAVTAMTVDAVFADIEQVVTFVRGPVQFGGARGEVVGGELRGSGTIEWRLDAPVALVDQSMEGSSTIRVDAGGGPQTIEQTQRQRYQLREA